MQSQRWTYINAGIQQHLQKLYNTNKAPLKAVHWVINPETRTNQAQVAQNRQNRAKSTVVCRQGSRSLARLRDQMMESSSTREYPSLIDTFFLTHTVGGVFVRDEDQALYDEMLSLQRLGSNTETGVPYTEEEIMAIVRKGKQRGHLPGIGRVLLGCATGGCPPPPQSTVDPVDVENLKKSNKSLTKQVMMMMRLFRSDNKFSQMLDQFESSPKFGGPSGGGGCGDDEPGGDEDDDEDEEDGELEMLYIWLIIDLYLADNASLTETLRAPPKSLGKVARERIPGELSPSTYPGRHVARDEFPQRQVARERREMSLEIMVNVVVSDYPVIL
ncbi:hypothetical protein Tco_1002441 [Tanacetum coccineum]|uniref:Uncharacterized protein n=1 Tax=Tanacetum coccineum TaxID=301880 RepID=A0ABQ5F7R6_9ASTR